jgi:hypothetical protein
VRLTEIGLVRLTEIGLVRLTEIGLVRLTEIGLVRLTEIGLVRLSVPEVRRLLWRLAWCQKWKWSLVLHWSQWRRRHQARAKYHHYKNRGSTLTV